MMRKEQGAGYQQAQAKAFRIFKCRTRDISSLRVVSLRFGPLQGPFLFLFDGFCELLSPVNIHLREGNRDALFVKGNFYFFR